ncbi:MAG: BMP family ABC transporter substrate-binding protein [Desulfurococcaceae archaeon]
MKTPLMAGIVLITAILSGLIGYFIGIYIQQGTLSQTPIQTWTPPEKIRAAWIYIGPIGDYGWSYMHEIGRRVVQELFKEWLETTYVADVSEGQLMETIDKLVQEGYNVIFTTSFDFMDKTIEAAKKYPNVMFFHCSGYKRAPNVGTYFADLYEVYYLNGLIAGALTKTGKIGYIAAHTIPEVVRHINAFAIGAKEVGEQLGKNIEVYVIKIGDWVAPQKAKWAAQELVERYNVDVLAFTEDTTATVEFAEQKGVYVFGHYSPMLKFGPNYVVSGQLVRWERIYADILVKIKAGVLTPYNLDKVDYWYLLSSGAVDLGADIDENGNVVMINPKYVDVLKNIIVVDKTDGQKLSVYDLVMKRYWQMKNAFLVIPLQFSSFTHKYENITSIYVDWGTNLGKLPYSIASAFDPFTGPLEGYCLFDPGESTSAYCRNAYKNAPVEIPSNVRLGHEDLWTMDWFLSYVKLVAG